jgi:hypothetical protein
MRHALAIALLLPVAGVIAQDKAPSITPPAKKGDAIAIYGCLRGSALEATDLGGSEDVSPVTHGMTFRLTGDKALLKEMKEKHDKKVVEVSSSPTCCRPHGRSERSARRGSRLALRRPVRRQPTRRPNARCLWSK